MDWFLGGLAGLAAIVVIVWFTRRDKAPDQRRAFTMKAAGVELSAEEGPVEDRAVAAPDAPARQLPTDPAHDAEFGPYVAALTARFESIRPPGFETRVRIPITFDEIYVPLRGMLDLGNREAGDATEADAHRLSAEANDLPIKDALVRARQIGRRRGVVIVGDPGTGKTTTMAWLLLQVLAGDHGVCALEAGALPVFLPLRSMTDPAAGFAAFAKNAIAELFDPPRPELADRLLQRGNVVFLLDGLDEVPDASKRESVARVIDRAIERRTDCTFVVTCRYAGYAGKAKLDVAQFLKVDLRPLGEDEAAEFVTKWYRGVERSLVRDVAAIETATKAAEQQAKELIARLAQPEFRARRVLELTRNPLLLTGICIVHRDRGKLPHRRAELYSECVSVLLAGWRESRRMAVSMPGAQARQVLQPVAYWMHGEEKRTRATGAALTPHVESALAAAQVRGMTARQFLETVRDESGLLTGWSGDSYGFLHLGFQEFLTAEEVRNAWVRDRDELKRLAARFGQSWWEEVGLLVASLTNPSVFEPYLAALCDEPAFARRADLVEMCFEDSTQASPAPLVRLLQRPPGDDRDLWARQLVALQVLLRRYPDAVAPLAAALAVHPSPEIRERFGRPVGVAGRISAQGGYELVRIPGGSFLMGSLPVRGDDDERPQHRVTVAAFELGRAPVTNEHYGLFLAANPGTAEPAYWSDRRYNQRNQPVVGVSWEDAQAYCKWAGVRLPSEAEWEYACRAGTQSEYWSGDTEEDLARVGWYNGNSGKTLHAVGEKPANAFGLHDMHGNVWEFCEDVWHPNHYGSPTDGSAWSDNASGGRVIRGGSFALFARYARSAYRLDFLPGNRGWSLGFRPARSVTA